MGVLEAYRFHEACLVFPEVSAEVLGELADDIKAHGLLEPIWTYRGDIIDGRNRLKACEIAGVEPRFQEWDGKGSLADFVLSKNLHRRHLTASQRAMIVHAFGPMLAAEIREETRKKQSEGGKVGGKTAGRGRERSEADREFTKNGKDPIEARNTQGELAEKAGTSKGYIADARKIAEASPEAAEAVKRGEKTIPQAKRELGLGKPKANGHGGTNGHNPALTPAGFVATEVHEPEEATRLADVAEDIGERAAISEDELGNEDWLATLPLFGKLQGRPLKIFRADALAYRLLEAARRSYKHHADCAFKAVGNNRGAFIGRAKSFLGIDHPRRWIGCQAPADGGCGGSGEVPLIGQCPECKGRGYRINNG